MSFVYNLSLAMYEQREGTRGEKNLLFHARHDDQIFPNPVSKGEIYEIVSVRNILKAMPYIRVDDIHHIKNKNRGVISTLTLSVIIDCKDQLVEEIKEELSSTGWEVHNSRK